MSHGQNLLTPKTPNLPLAPAAFERRYFDLLNNALTLYFRQIDNALQVLINDLAERRTYNTTDTTVTVADEGGTYLVDTTAGNVTVNLPNADVIMGDPIIIKRITGGVNTLTIQPGSGNIDGAATKTLTTQYEVVTLQSDGTDFWIVGN